MWQCELSQKAVPVDAPNRWWVDYKINYNIVLEAAFQNKQKEALLEGPTPEEGDWKCCLRTMVQTNTLLGTTRRMRRSVVTM